MARVASHLEMQVLDRPALGVPGVAGCRLTSTGLRPSLSPFCPERGLDVPRAILLALRGAGTHPPTPQLLHIQSTAHLSA